jgi:hypothetical protein
MAQSNPAGDVPTHLQRNQEIDAICDRFELAWDAPHRPRIEDYLDLVPADGRSSLLFELLASELALLRRKNEVCDRAAYAERFPQYLDIVARLFDLRHQPAQETVALDERLFEIITAFRFRQQSKASTTAIHDSEKDLPALVRALLRDVLKNPAEVAAPPDQLLWLWIIHTCRERNSFDLSGVEALVNDLLESFSPVRQSILIDLLHGRACNRAAQANGVTQRTVMSTVLIATKLLKSSG